VEKIEVERSGMVRRAKLTYLRKRVGKGATAVKEKLMAATTSRAATATPAGTTAEADAPAAAE
jgi:hypothetical protein